MRFTIAGGAVIAALALGTGVCAAQDTMQDALKINLAGRSAVPDIDKLPNDAYGRLVRYGQALTDETYKHIGPEVKDQAMRYAGNNLACTSCHRQNGTLVNAIPLIGVSAVFPQYRAREDEVSTLEDRVNGCMQRSMNGKSLPLDSREMKAFIAYMHFLSRGIPVGAVLEVAETPPMKLPNRRADTAAGAKLFTKKCTMCHGTDGQGVRNGPVGDAGGYELPPLWGPDSFNDGAGMNRLSVASRFIRYNMVNGKLSDDEAYDVAAYVLSQPRPHKAGVEKDFPAGWNKPVDAPFPPYMDGVSADQHRYGPFPPLQEKAKKLAEENQARQAAGK